MPEIEQIETPGQRVKRQWYQGKLGERLLQAGQMALSRKMLRRGAIKQQNGTLGQPDETIEPWDDAMEIRVGDEIHNHYSETPSTPSAPAESGDTTRAHKARSSWLLPAALAVGAAMTGGAVPTAYMVWQAINAASEPAPPAAVDHDTTRRIDIEKWIPPAGS